MKFCHWFDINLNSIFSESESDFQEKGKLTYLDQIHSQSSYLFLGKKRGRSHSRSLLTMTVVHQWRHWDHTQMTTFYAVWRKAPVQISLYLLPLCKVHCVLLFTWSSLSECLLFFFLINLIHLLKIISCPFFHLPPFLENYFIVPSQLFHISD